jgi:hypothetical protein
LPELQYKGCLAIHDGGGDNIFEYTGELFALVRREKKLFRFSKVS